MILLDPSKDIITAECGGKAYRLYKLSKIFNVPKFFVVKHSVDISSTQNMELNMNEMSKIQSYSVRSSASVEDDENYSFAGLFDTFLNVPYHKINEYVEKVMLSIKKNQVKEYYNEKNIKTKIQMSVIIQEMIIPDSSGVALSHSPLDSNNIIVEAIFGLGEVLVSSKSEPDTWEISRKNNALITHRKGRQLLCMDAMGMNFLEPTRQLMDKLSTDQLFLVVHALKKVESQLNIRLADIEFAFKDNQFYMLQARPLIKQIRREGN